MSETSEPRSEGGFRYSDRSQVLCRTCMRALTWETRTEPGYLPRTGWYDDARSDPRVCFKAVDYRHVPLTDREWAYYEAGERVGAAFAKNVRVGIQKALDYWEGRPLRTHGEHIHADLLELLALATPDPSPAAPGRTE
jgi:hypothetical protein